MLEKFRKFIDWKELSNTGCETILTEETLEQYKAYWDWSVLSGNSELKLNYQQIDRFIDLWDWSELITVGARKNYILLTSWSDMRIRYHPASFRTLAFGLLSLNNAKRI
jgi:hypothetical protein